MIKTRKITLSEQEIPEQWYNIVADMPNKPLPPLHPGTKEPIGPEALAPLFPQELIKQEVSTEKWITIPDEVRNIYSLWRPTPVYRAYELEKVLDTPAKIYYKYEGVSPAGSQAKHGCAAGLLQYERRRKAHYYGNRSRAMGKRIELCLQPF
ncbi:hypothetical protein [Niabella ginsengisoli]|uniref:Pyridoxal-phosphate dependent enzyme n=1 Tax=Niabella ginsengisoli TaxID=522298 RepID=A0ABS9SNB4_9BACT|nr:hypothetical protein [Niabella ginsengisoli]MCH5599878.1 hypothetical protein [Niabella ginsengisoli]